MAISNKWWEFHLTPKGWIPGSFQLDIDKVQQADVPSDTFLTCRYIEKSSDQFSPLIKIFEVSNLKDDAIADELLSAYPFPGKYYASFKIVNGKGDS